MKAREPYLATTMQEIRIRAWRLDQGSASISCNKAASSKALHTQAYPYHRGLVCETARWESDHFFREAAPFDWPYHQRPLAANLQQPKLRSAAATMTDAVGWWG